MAVTFDDSRLESRYQQCMAQLVACGQEQILRWWDELDSVGRDHLLTEIESIGWGELEPIIQSHVLAKPPHSIPAQLEPAEAYPVVPETDEHGRLYRDAVDRGEALIRAGKVAALTVAGGQGTRLGFDGPKGMLPITPIRKKTLFELFGETIVAHRARFQAAIPWYVMTSPSNHEATVTYFREKDFFGLPAGDVSFFTQGMLPAFGFDGKVLMAEKHRMALSPDGHGGSLRALVTRGALEAMRSTGIEVLSYFQVDNPLARPIDPLFVGLHALSGSEMSTKVTPKADDLERVGHVCQSGGRVVMVEYTDLPEALARAKHSDGSRKFDLANLAIHALNVSFVDRIIARAFELPYRRAEKAVPFIDTTGRLHRPAEPNAVKLETFVFDALPLAEHAMVFQVDRAEEFSPVKNATGVDSIESARRDQIRRAARWLESAGVDVPRTAEGEPDFVAEIAPSYATDIAELRRRRSGQFELHHGQALLLE